MPISALIGAGASLLGGFLNRPKRTSARQNTREGIMGQAQGARDAAERYGFNPLTLLGVSSALGPSESANYMGSSIAEAGLLLADAYSRREEAGTLSKVQAENQKLQDKVKDLTLRPPVPGVFAQRQAEAESYSADSAGRPRARPTPANADRVPAYDPSGRMVHLLPDVAARLDIAPFGNIMAGDWVELVGEIGEVETALGSAGVRQTALGVPWHAQRESFAKPPHIYLGPMEVLPSWRGPAARGQSSSPGRVVLPNWRGTFPR